MKSLPSAPQSLRLASFCSGLRCELAAEFHQFASAFQITYGSYCQRGLIRPNATGLWMTRHHLLPTTRVFVMRSFGPGQGTLTLAEDGPLGLPMETLFGQEVDQCRNLQGSIAEATCLAFDKRGSSTGSAMVSRLMGVVAQAARLSGVTQILIAVHPRHVPYYARIAGFRPVGLAKPYPAVRGQLAVPLALHLPSLAKTCPAAYLKFFHMEFPTLALHARPTPESTIQRLTKVWRSIQSEAPVALPETPQATKTYCRAA